ncbi:MAG: squalene/phytoene synthase family protein [Dehalococcoidia bacterium]
MVHYNFLPMSYINNEKAKLVWTQEDWEKKHSDLKQKILNHQDETLNLDQASTWGKIILKKFSSSFYTVTRLLPENKKKDVQIIYAAVRYPDEVVDSFNLAKSEKIKILKKLELDFVRSKKQKNIYEMLNDNISLTIAGFRDVCNRYKIPENFYLSFLDAMKKDIEPKEYENWNDLIDNYIFGSATVVGYFLSYVYGHSKNSSLEECMETSKSLAIALQLTNFARDVSEDSIRGRCYLPNNHQNENKQNIYNGVIKQNIQDIISSKFLLANEAKKWYDNCSNKIDNFTEDSRLAILACHKLYSKLNNKILKIENNHQRESLSLFEKISIIPKKKYLKLAIALVMNK